MSHEIPSVSISKDPGFEPTLLPRHAYVPGESARHPELYFEELRRVVRQGMTVGQLTATSAYRHGVYYLQVGYFWEAHELLEPVWMALPDDSEERKLVQALIQTANGFLKLRMRKPGATRRLCDLARGLLADIRSDKMMMIDIGALKQCIDQLEAKSNDAL